MSLESLMRRLERIPREVKAAVEPALVKSGEELQARMQHLVPTDTGGLRDSIAVTPPGQSTPADAKLGGGSRVAKENEVIVSAGNADAFYARWVEFGTVKTPAQPFFFVSYRLAKKRIQNRLKRAISKAVKKGWQQ